MIVRNRESYTRTIELSFIVSLIILILIFYLYPRFKQSSDQNLQYTAPSIEVLNIPSTTQELNKIPKPVKPFIPVESDDIEILDNIEIEELVEGDSAATNILSGPVNYTELPYTPRQLFDIIPEKTEEPVSGIIVLSLRIGVDGSVKDYKVVQNTTNNSTCLGYVVKAVMQSRWESAVLREQKVEYWIDKTYRFK
jgi:hypothetical protein